MRLKNKGFTLIELLAVIVILAVIALIATPIIMNVINDSKEGAAKDAMYGYVKAVELATTKKITPTTDAPDGDYTTENGNIKKDSEIFEVSFKGSKPKDDGSITLSKGNVTSADLIIDGIHVTYDGKIAEVVKGGSGTPTPPPTSAPSKAYTEGDIIYYNPETNKKCTSGEVNTTVNAKTGCMKWNVITVGDTVGNTTVDIMLDHNTTGKVAWASKEDYIAAGGTEADYNAEGANNNKGSITVTKQLQTDVATWNSSIKSTARLITGQEVASIVKNISWTTGGIVISLSTQSWLYQNTFTMGDNTTQGYWTSTANTASVNGAWLVYYSGKLSHGTVSIDSSRGVRPVVRVLKSDI